MMAQVPVMKMPMWKVRLAPHLQEKMNNCLKFHLVGKQACVRWVVTVWEGRK